MAAGAGGAVPAPRGAGRTDRSPADRRPASGSGDDPDAEHDGDEPGEDAPRWGGGDVALGILASVLAANITLLLALSLSGVATFVPERGFDIGWAMGQTLTDSELEALPTWGNLSIEWRLLGNVGLWVGLVGVTLWAVRTKGSNLRDDLGLRFEAGDVPLGLVVGAIGFGAVQLLMWPIAALVGSEAVSAPARSLSDSASGPLGVAALIVMVVVIAPFVEELFYRGLALRAFTRRMGERWGLVASALVFAALHLQDLQFPALVLVGLGCGYLAQRYGRLGPAIFAHVGYNAVNVAILVWVL